MTSESGKPPDGDPLWTRSRSRPGDRPGAEGEGAPATFPAVSVPGAGGLTWRRGSSVRVGALFDQVLSGLSNFLAVALIARSATPVQFGRFALVYALYIALLALARQLWGTRISMTSSAEDARRQARRLLGATLYAAPFAACVLALPSLLLTDGHALAVIVALVITLPVAAAQDLCRHAAVSSGRPLVAAASDGLWAVVVAVGYAFRPTMGGALLTWMGGAVAALALALIALRLTPSFSQAWSALSERHPTSEVNALSTIGFSLASYATLGLATVFLSAAAAGALRGASTVMAPVNSLFAFVGLALLPVAFRTPPARLAGLVARVSGLLVTLTLAWGGALLVAPGSVGRLVLGESWRGARSVLPFTVVEYVGLAITIGVALGFQARKEAGLLAAVALVPAGLATAAAVVAATVADSPRTFAAALAIASMTSAVAAIAIYFRFAREPRHTRS